MPPGDWPLQPHGARLTATEARLLELLRRECGWTLQEVVVLIYAGGELRARVVVTQNGNGQEP